VLAFGAGALISSVRFELFEDGIRVGGAAAVGIGLAAGALLVMLVDSMIPEATSKSGRVAGLATTLGFALAAGLSTASA
jgi:ZIP family zinc transporter